jgi:phage tail sheath protein FI
MPEFLHPGVFIEEIESGPRPIEGVPTSTAAFLGEAERGSVTPRMVSSHKEYQRWFGTAAGAESFLPDAVNGFFDNGGRCVFICRVVGRSAKPAHAAFGDFVVRAAGPGSWGNRVFAKISDSKTTGPDGTSGGFSLRLAYWSGTPGNFDPFTSDGRAASPRPSLVEEFDDLVLDEKSSDYFGKRVPFIDLGKGSTNQGPESSALGIFVRKCGAGLHTRPANGAQWLAAGRDATKAIGTDDYVGDPQDAHADKQGLAALELDPYRDVALVYAPNVSNEVALKIIDHCERLRFRFAVIDCPKGQNNPSGLAPRDTLSVDTSYAGFYYPWIVAADSVSGARKLIPPGGHVLGVYARTDSERGVFKAPANETLHGALALEFDINDETLDALSPKGVNVIRSLPGRGIRVWGAHTLASNALWKYISIRRLFIFLERSIYEGTQWVVFEPNDAHLWARVTDTIRAFLRAQWRAGALLGRTEDQAFFIICNETVMTQDDIINGRLICEIGVAPVRPAEFVIFRIFQHTAEAQR